MELTEVDEPFWQALDELVAASNVVIDRPRGSAHPRYPDFIYPFDYGFLESTLVSDGGGVDVWVGGLPERKVQGVIITIDLLKRDLELKLLLGCSPVEAHQILEVHNSGMQAGMLHLRPFPVPLPGSANTTSV